MVPVGVPTPYDRVSSMSHPSGVNGSSTGDSSFDRPDPSMGESDFFPTVTRKRRTEDSDSSGVPEALNTVTRRYPGRRPRRSALWPTDGPTDDEVPHTSSTRRKSVVGGERSLDSSKRTSSDPRRPDSKRRKERDSTTTLSPFSVKVPLSA